MAAGAYDHFPLHRAGRWVFERRTDGAPTGAEELLSAPSGTVSGLERRYGDRLERVRYRWTSRGWEVELGFALGLPDKAALSVGLVLAYPAKFHPPGQPWVQERRGDYGADIDGDGINEGFDLRVTASVSGPEVIDGPSGLISTLRLQTQIALTILPSSSTRGPDLTRYIESIEWLAPGVGPITTRRWSHDSSGQRSPVEESHLQSASLDGTDPLRPEPLLAGPNGSQTRVIELPHSAMVADPARGVYYASVPDIDPARGGRVATVDARTGSITASAPLGSQLGPLAMAGDGASLYVGAKTSGELIRLELPGLREISRTRLPSDPTLGQLHALSLAASPIDRGVVAVALANAVDTSFHGVALVRDGTVFPPRRPLPLGPDHLVFSDDGLDVYGVLTGISPGSLHRLRIIEDGLRHESEFTLEGGIVNSLSIDRQDDQLVFDSWVFGTNMVQRGRIDGVGGCRTASSPFILCLSRNVLLGSELLLFDSASFILLNAWPLTAMPLNFGRKLTLGIPGQAAVSDGLTPTLYPASLRIMLVSAPSLP